MKQVIVKRFIIQPVNEVMLNKITILKLPKTARFLKALPSKDKEILIFASVEDDKKITEFEVHCIKSGEIIPSDIIFLDVVQLHREIFEFIICIRIKA